MSMSVNTFTCMFLSYHISSLTSLQTINTIIFYLLKLEPEHDQTAEKMILGANNKQDDDV